MKKTYCMLTLLCGLFATRAIAEIKVTDSSSSDTEVQIEGFYNFTLGTSKQTNMVKGMSSNLTTYQKNIALDTNAAFLATIKQRIDEVIVGAKIVLMPTSKPNVGSAYGGSYAYLESIYGRVELGSPYDAAAKMRVTAGSAAVGVAWAQFIVLTGKNMLYKNIAPDFASSEGYYLESIAAALVNDKETRPEASRKVSFFTPNIAGFQFGVSYVPDSSNNGANRKLRYTIDEFGGVDLPIGFTEVNLPDEEGVPLRGKAILINQNVRDAFSLALSYQAQPTDEWSFKFAVTSEIGKAAMPLYVIGKDPNDSTKKQIVQKAKLSDLRTFSVGGMVTYNNISLAASYGTMGKSLTNPIYYRVGRNTEYYNVALGYVQGPIKASIAGFKSYRYKNILELVSLATEYKLSAGFIPYTGLSFFKAKGRPVYFPEAPLKTTNGTVFSCGVKVKL